MVGHIVDFNKCLKPRQNTGNKKYFLAIEYEKKILIAVKALKVMKLKRNMLQNDESNSD